MMKLLLIILTLSGTSLIFSEEKQTVETFKHHHPIQLVAVVPDDDRPEDLEALFISISSNESLKGKYVVVHFPAASLSAHEATITNLIRTFKSEKASQLERPFMDVCFMVPKEHIEGGVAASGPDLHQWYLKYLKPAQHLTAPTQDN